MKVVLISYRRNRAIFQHMTECSFPKAIATFTCHFPSAGDEKGVAYSQRSRVRRIVGQTKELNLFPAIRYSLITHESRSERKLDALPSQC
jgi:hypothetical protein